MSILVFNYLYYGTVRWVRTPGCILRVCVGVHIVCIFLCEWVWVYIIVTVLINEAARTGCRVRDGPVIFDSNGTMDRSALKDERYY